MARHSAAPRSLGAQDTRLRTAAVGRADLLRFLADHGEAGLDAMAACAGYERPQPRAKAELSGGLRLGPATVTAINGDVRRRLRRRDRAGRAALERGSSASWSTSPCRPRSG